MARAEAVVNTGVAHADVAAADDVADDTAALDRFFEMVVLILLMPLIVVYKAMARAIEAAQ